MIQESLTPIDVGVVRLPRRERAEKPNIEARTRRCALGGSRVVDDGRLDVQGTDGPPPERKRASSWMTMGRT